MFEKVIMESEKKRKENLQAQAQRKILRLESNFDLMAEAEKVIAYSGNETTAKRQSLFDAARKHLDLIQAGEYTGISHRTLRKWIDKGAIPFVWIAEYGGRPKKALSTGLCAKLKALRKKHKAADVLKHLREADKCI